uniref:Uncharacterized protein n=1 Tax=Parascaris equorum TaxID=6256 RepID=A0A914RT44_PAREQ
MFAIVKRQRRIFLCGKYRSIFRLAVFLTARQASFVVMAVEQTRIDAVPKTSTLSVLVENLKIGQGPIIGIQTTCWDSMGNMTTQHMCGEGGRLIARSSTAPNSLNLVLLADAPVMLVWDPVVHIVFLETYRWVLLCIQTHPKGKTEKSGGSVAESGFVYGRELSLFL